MSSSLRRSVAARLALRLAATFPRFSAARLRNPCIVIGCGRSGTTLLGHLLATHPDVAVFPREGNDLWHPDVYPYHRATVTTPPFWQDPVTFTERSLAARTDPRGRAVRATFGAFQLLAGGRVFVNKSVMVTFMLEFVQRVFPEARYIHVYRDGRAVSLSYTEKQRGKIEDAPGDYRQRGYAVDRMSLLPQFAEHWTRHIAEIERQKTRLDLNLLEFSYEAFCADPAAHLRRVGEFLDIDPAGFRLAGTAVTSTNNKFREQIDSRTLEELERIMADTLQLKGYAP